MINVVFVDHWGQGQVAIPDLGLVFSAGETSDQVCTTLGRAPLTDDEANLLLTNPNFAIA